MAHGQSYASIVQLLSATLFFFTSAAQSLILYTMALTVALMQTDIGSSSSVRMEGASSPGSVSESSVHRFPAIAHSDNAATSDSPNETTNDIHRSQALTNLVQKLKSMFPKKATKLSPLRAELLASGILQSLHEDTTLDVASFEKVLNLLSPSLAQQRSNPSKNTKGRNLLRTITSRSIDPTSKPSLSTLDQLFKGKTYIVDDASNQVYPVSPVLMKPSINSIPPIPENHESQEPICSVCSQNLSQSTEHYLTLALVAHEQGQYQLSFHYLNHSVYPSSSPPTANTTAGKNVDPTKMTHQALPIFLYGMSLRHGWGVQPDVEASYVYLYYAMKTSFSALIATSAPNSPTTVPTMYRHGPWTLYPPSHRQTLSLILYELSPSFRYGWGVEKNPQLAFDILEFAANLGEVDAQVECGRHFLSKNIKKRAARYYRMALKNGYSEPNLTWVWKTKYDE
ncbi:hypothetical protein BKA69DRAFT_1045077 [Paraphysoderma sedebokerense]|nr:hypothetical protein BKA69DRAFT_1045077 [Paraphysoderma sedebokerense]